MCFCMPRTILSAIKHLVFLFFRNLRALNWLFWSSLSAVVKRATEKTTKSVRFYDVFCVKNMKIANLHCWATFFLLQIPFFLWFSRIRQAHYSESKTSFCCVKLTLFGTRKTSILSRVCFFIFSLKNEFDFF